MADAVKPKQPPRGRFITFEGGEGSGKSKKAAEQEAAKVAYERLLVDTAAAV